MANFSRKYLFGGIIFCCMLIYYYLLYTVDFLYFRTFVENHYLMSVILFVSFYIIATTCCIPTTAPLSMLGGFLFGPYHGTLYNIMGATVGGTSSFLLIRYIIGNRIQRYYQHQLAKVNSNLEQYGGYYLMIMRALSIVPFFIGNIAAGLTSISTTTFMLSTLIGIIPGTFLYTCSGYYAPAFNTNIYAKFFVTIVGVLVIFMMLYKQYQKKRGIL